MVTGKIVVKKAKHTMLLSPGYINKVGMNYWITFAKLRNRLEKWKSDKKRAIVRSHLVHCRQMSIKRGTGEILPVEGTSASLFQNQCKLGRVSEA